MKKMLVTALVVGLFAGCSSGGGGSSPDVPSDTAQGDVSADIAGEVPEEDVVAEFPFRGLPFEFTRPPKGTAPTDTEIADFTVQVTGLWKKVGIMRWLLRTSTGVDPSTGQEDFLAWYNDIAVTKVGDTLTFKHQGGEHNMWIPGSKILSQVTNGCVLTGDWETCKLAEQYCKGLTASVKGFVWGDNDPAPYLMARAVFPNDHSFTLDETVWKDDGRKKVVEYHHMHNEESHWNANTFPWENNPTWGSIWVTNMRSKDDVCAIVRSTTFLPYIIQDAPFDWVRDACQETWETMQGFNKDIVDYNYEIRTKDRDGTARLVPEQDLASYMWYVGMDEGNECPARLASDLIAYGERRTNDCKSGTGTVFDMVSTAIHYYNYPIVWDYHMAAAGLALAFGLNEDAEALVRGLADRIDGYMGGNPDEPGATNARWNRDMAVLLVKMATMGLPLTGAEARHVHQYWLKAVEELDAWTNWDLWSSDVPDGDYPGGGGVRPTTSNDAVPVDCILYFLEYCNSPFRNPASAKFVDCDQVADISRWGVK
jgi:hypothetical protein